jgi:hypothetical protein
MDSLEALGDDVAEGCFCDFRHDEPVYELDVRM